MKELELFLSHLVKQATVFVTIIESAKTKKNKNATKFCIQMTLAAIHSGNFIQNLPIFYVKVVNRSYKCE